MQVPVWIGWIKYLSFVFWGYNLLIKVQFRGATYYDNGVPVDLKVGGCVFNGALCIKGGVGVMT